MLLKKYLLLVFGSVLKVWRVRLKDGRSVNVRFFTLNDKEKVAEMFSSISDDALRWGMPPYTEERLDRWFANIKNLIPLVAEYQGRIFGYAHIFKHSHDRRRGTGSLIIYLHQDFQNVGLGTAMLRRLVKLREEQHMHRLGLSVVSDNKIAVHVYKKVGFKVEGVLKDAYFGDDGRYHDELVMGLILD